EVRIHVADAELRGTVRADVLDRRFAGLAAVSRQDEEAKGIHDVVGGVGARVRRVPFELLEASHPARAVNDAERLARLVIEDVLPLATRVHAERRDTHLIDLLARTVTRDAERVAEVRLIDDPRIERELSGLRRHIRCVLPLILEAARLRLRQRNVEERALRQALRIHQFEIEAIQERRVDAVLIFGLDRRLQLLVADVLLRDATRRHRVRLVLVVEARAETSGSACRPELELLNPGDMEVLAESIRTRDAI